MPVQIIRSNALALPLADDSVDLVVTSPPYFGLRSYQDGGEHYTGQIGDEPTPAEFVEALIAATAEMVRVVKPSGSIWVNLGDKYSGAGRGNNQSDRLNNTTAMMADRLGSSNRRQHLGLETAPAKSLMGIPWRYAIRCIDELGLILRAEVIWSKPNGLPESVTDRVRRSHEQWFHFTLEPRYYSAVDMIREPHAEVSIQRAAPHRANPGRRGDEVYGNTANGQTLNLAQMNHPLGKLPGSVWTIPTEPLHVPESLGVDHFAAFPTEWPRRIVQGWSPAGICTDCGEGRRPVVDKEKVARAPSGDAFMGKLMRRSDEPMQVPNILTSATITGESCGCIEPTAPTRPGVVLDPFGGTGTTALVADALGRHGISVDMSADYCRLAGWRTTDPKQRAKAARRDYQPPREQVTGQLDLLGGAL